MNHFLYISGFPFLCPIQALLIVIYLYPLANVFHRDLKPKNILANADCKLKICYLLISLIVLNLVIAMSTQVDFTLKKRQFIEILINFIYCYFSIFAGSKTE